MDAKAFALLAELKLPSPCRLLPSACSPDKDLVALISRLGGKDRLSLWKMQGPKKWEVDVGTEKNRAEEIVGLAWSPSGQSIAIAHRPPRITLHSVQDGHEERVLHIQSSAATPTREHHITKIWWFQQEKVKVVNSIPDIFGRNNIITGSAHSILKMLPLLDHLADEVQKTTATDLFAFQGSHVRSSQRTSLPDPIEHWPALHTDLLAASMSSSLEGLHQPHASGKAANASADPNIDTFLVASVDQGHLYYFLDGSYPLGAVSLRSESDLSLSLPPNPSQPMFLAHLRVRTDTGILTDLLPTAIELPLLAKRHVRDMARLSSTARELVWYIMRVVKEMRVTWFGSETVGGARELGPKWVRLLETRQKEKFGQHEPHPVLDLTALLLTGRASETLADFLGSGEQMSERGLQKWESTMADALVKLRDYSEKRVAPASQALRIVLQEVNGWWHLPSFAAFELSGEDLKACLGAASKAILISSWLASVARRELARFKEFIKWLTFETAVLNSTEARPQPRHDILEVNKYFMSGLVVSSIDKWFIGPVPQLAPHDLGLGGEDKDLPSVLQRARAVLDDPAQLASPSNVKQSDYSHVERNLDALVQELATRCQRIFTRAAGAATRSAVIKARSGASLTRALDARLSDYPLIIRERVVGGGNEAGNPLQYLVIQVASEGRSFLCITRMKYEHEGFKAPLQVAVSVLRCCCRVPPDAEDIEGTLQDFELLQTDFFDDESIVIVYRLVGESGSTFLGTVTYNDLGYKMLDGGDGSGGKLLKLGSREDLVQHTMDLLRKGLLPSVEIPIKRCRELTCRNGNVHLAVNGRAGRRVACVLDDRGTTMEVLDMEAEDEEDGGEEEATQE